MRVTDEASLLDAACDTLQVTALLRDGRNVDPKVRGLKVRSANVMRYKPGKRCLIKYHGVDSNGSVVDFLGKIRFKGLDEKSAAIQQTLTSLLKNNGSVHSTEPVAVPRVYGVLPSLNMWLQEFVSQAVPLDFGSRDFISAQSSVAYALARLHQTPVANLNQYTVDDELAMLRKRLSQLKQTHPELNALVDRLMKKAAAVCDELRFPSLQTAIHRDFYFEQVLLSHERTILVDLDLCCCGPPELDVGNYIGHLHEYAFRCPNVAVLCKDAAQAFTQAYFAEMPQANYDAVQHWTTLTLARHVLLSTCLPGRSHTTLSLFRAAIEN